MRRKARTDRLVLRWLLDQEAESKQRSEAEIDAAHKTLIQWADLESNGRLQRMSEKQLQGEFFTSVFGDALHYTRFSEGAEEWQLEQELSFFGGTPDAILGHFKSGGERKPTAVIELKGPTAVIDRDRFNGRTAVQQCWDYLDNLPDCRWGIVSFRLYERAHTARRYEHFSLQGPGAGRSSAGSMRCSNAAG